MTHLHQTLSVPGTYEFLKALDHTAEISMKEQLLARMADNGVTDPQRTFGQLVSANILESLDIRFTLSTFGIRSFVLLEALNGGDIGLTYQRLSRLDPALNRYELVREGMTADFLEDINARPDFARLYICSPWITLTRRGIDLLAHAVQSAEAGGENPELLVLTRPGKNGRAPEGTSPLQDLGATVFLNPNLHTKLYIREPGKGGGYAVAVVGSQNLTRSRYLELGIRINSDGRMIDRLISYFLELSNRSKEVPTDQERQRT